MNTRNRGIVMATLVAVVGACSTGSSGDSEGSSGGTGAGSGLSGGGFPASGGAGGLGGIGAGGSNGGLVGVGASGGTTSGGVTGAPGGTMSTGGEFGQGGTGGGIGVGGNGGGQGGAGQAAGASGTGASGGTTAGTGGIGSGGTAGMNGMGGSTSAATGPCDIYGAATTPCVAAHSTIRSLYGSYGGKLYQVRRSSDNTTADIGALSPGGFADAAAQDTFCSNTNCVITVVFDQSGKGNDLDYQGQGSPVGGRDNPASATGESLTIGGHKVYSLYINPGNSYWRDGSQSGVPTGAAPEALYMVTSGTHVNGGCCFDYGNSETDRKADGAGAMDAINFGTECWFGGCSGSGPWVQADLEYGLYPGGSQSWNPNQKAFPNQYVTAILKNNGTSAFALKGANAQSGGLTTVYDGKLPNGYSPMKKQGAIILGSGGDCCANNNNLSLGTFYEGAIVSGYPSDATDDSIQNNIVATGYGG